MEDIEPKAEPEEYDDVNTGINQANPTHENNQLPVEGPDIPEGNDVDDDADDDDDEDEDGDDDGEDIIEGKLDVDGAASEPVPSEEICAAGLKRYATDSDDLVGAKTQPAMDTCGPSQPPPTNPTPDSSGDSHPPLTMEDRIEMVGMHMEYSNCHLDDELRSLRGRIMELECERTVTRMNYTRVDMDVREAQRRAMAAERRAAAAELLIREISGNVRAALAVLNTIFPPPPPPQ